MAERCISGGGAGPRFAAAPLKYVLAAGCESQGWTFALSHRALAREKSGE
jgi:hypothetical protein